MIQHLEGFTLALIHFSYNGIGRSSRNRTAGLTFGASNVTTTPKTHYLLVVDDRLELSIQRYERRGIPVSPIHVLKISNCSRLAGSHPALKKEPVCGNRTPGATRFTLCTYQPGHWHWRMIGGIEPLAAHHSSTCFQNKVCFPGTIIIQ